MDEQPAAKTGPHLIHEADVGSGEKSPGQQETDALIDQISERSGPRAGPATPPPPPKSATANRDLAVTPNDTPVSADSASAAPPRAGVGSS